MKIIMQRRLCITVVQCIAKIEVEEQRKDIQDFLNGLQQGSNQIPELVYNRICEYLQKRKLLDTDNQLTPEGQEVLKTGNLFQPEEGKYRFWCVLDDPLVQSQLLHFRREKPEKMNTPRNGSSSPMPELKSLCEQEHWTIPLQEQEQEARHIRVQQIGHPESPMAIADIDRASSVTLNWQWDDLENSTYSFEGMLVIYGKNKSIAQNAYPGPIDLAAIWIRLLEQNQIAWNATYHRAMINFNKEVTPAEVYRNFLQSQSLHTDSFEYGSFDNAEVQEMPVMPNDEEAAKAWRDWLLTEWLERDYVTSQQFQEKNLEINSHHAFKMFDLQMSNIDQLCSHLCSFNKQAFWHLVAPIDLKPKYH